MTNSVDPDSAASDQGLCCFQKPACPNTLGYYGILSTHYKGLGKALLMSTHNVCFMEK